ncbi:LIM-domain binding protein-domain-containing protein [Fennellomyces sp. T-0311]|nr:LIM-domain binding protein-domain-containing protein [Fennellomyces sp. T-0311]
MEPPLRSVVMAAHSIPSNTPYQRAVPSLPSQGQPPPPAAQQPFMASQGFPQGVSPNYLYQHRQQLIAAAHQQHLQQQQLQIQQQRLQQQQQQMQQMQQDRQRQDQQEPQHIARSGGQFPPTPIIVNQPRTPAYPMSNGTTMKQHLPTPAMTTAPLPSSTGLCTSQAVLKLMQFSDGLSPPNDARELATWISFTDEFFTRTGVLKFTLWNSETDEKRLHSISRPSIARIFHTQYECGVTSLQLTLDQTNEYFLSNGMLLECPRSSFIYRYENGSLVILSGVLSVVLLLDPSSGSLKIDQFDFECSKHEEFISRQSVNVAATPSKKKSKKPPPSIMPDSPVGLWGIPERILQMMLIADAGSVFADIAFSAIVCETSPGVALKIRAHHSQEQIQALRMARISQQQAAAAATGTPTGFYPNASIPLGTPTTFAMSGPMRMPPYTNMQQVTSSPNAMPANTANYTHVPSPLGSSPVITNKRKPNDDEDEDVKPVVTPRKKKAVRK